MSPRRLRALLWHVGAGLLALSVAFIVTSLVEHRMQALGQPVAVLIAREAIPAYSAIRPDQVQVVRLPAAAIAEGALRDPVELEGRLARVEIPPGVPLYRSQVVRASDLRYTTDGLPAHAPGNLFKPGQRVDIWTDGSIIARGLRVVAVSSLSDGLLMVAVEAGQEVVPRLLTASSGSDLALTLSPLERLPTPTVLPVTATPTSIPSTVCCPTPTSSPTATASPTVTPTPGAAVVKPGPAQGLNVRAGPGTSYAVIATLHAGSRLTPIGRDADGRWVEVCCVADGQSGWVLAELVDLAVDFASLPVRQTSAEERLQR